MSELRFGGFVGRSVLSDDIYIVIRDLILDHDLPPGARVNIDALSARLDVSPTPVREALARLESDGLVVKRPLRGYSTTPLLTPREFEELTQFRILLEQFTAEHAAVSVGAAAADDLRSELARGASAAGPVEADVLRALIEHDLRFHGRIAELGGNSLVAQSFERMHFHLHFLRLYLASLSAVDEPRAAARLEPALARFDQAGAAARTIADHTAIADAIIAGDGSLAAARMRDHIEGGLHRFLPIVEALEQIAPSDR